MGRANDHDRERLAELSARPGDWVWRRAPKRVRAKTGEIVIQEFVTERFVGEVILEAMSEVPT